MGLFGGGIDIGPLLQGLFNRGGNAAPPQQQRQAPASQPNPRMVKPAAPQNNAAALQQKQFSQAMNMGSQANGMQPMAKPAAPQGGGIMGGMGGALGALQSQFNSAMQRGAGGMGMQPMQPNMQAALQNRQNMMAAANNMGSTANGNMQPQGQPNMGMGGYGGQQAMQQQYSGMGQTPRWEQGGSMGMTPNMRMGGMGGGLFGGMMSPMQSLFQQAMMRGGMGSSGMGGYGGSQMGQMNQYRTMGW